MALAAVLSDDLALVLFSAAGFWIVYSFGKRHEFSQFSLGFTANIALAYSLKCITHIPHPLGQAGYLTYAFPSGHTEIAFFIAGFFFRKHPRLAGLALLIGALIAAERVASGAHTAFQVAGGAIIGWLAAEAFARWKAHTVGINELKRQLVHLLGVLFIPLALVASPLAAGAAALLGAAAAYAGVKWKWKVVEPFRREGDAIEPVLFFLSIAAVLFLFSQMAAFAAVAALTIGDSLATVYGRYFGSLHWMHGKTLEGSAMAFLGTFAALLVLSATPWQAAFVSAAVVVAEAAAPRKWDNAVVPFTAALAFVWLGG